MDVANRCPGSFKRCYLTLNQVIHLLIDMDNTFSELSVNAFTLAHKSEYNLMVKYSIYWYISTYVLIRWSIDRYCIHGYRYVYLFLFCRDITSSGVWVGEKIIVNSYEFMSMIVWNIFIERLFNATNSRWWIGGDILILPSISMYILLNGHRPWHRGRPKSRSLPLKLSVPV